MLQDNPKQAVAVRGVLLRWQRDRDLACVRDEKAMPRLAEAEQELWRRFWSDVAALLNTATKK